MSKIMFVANSAWSMVKFRYSLMQTVIEEGHELFVLAPYDKFVYDIEMLGAVFIHLEMDNSGANILSDFILINRLHKTYKEIKPDIIFHYTIKPNIYGSIAANYANIISISMITGLGYTFIHNNLTSKVARRLYRFALQYSHEIWFINQDDKDYFLKCGIVDEKKCLLLPGEGVNAQRYMPVKLNKNKNEKFIFILIARLLWDKGVGEYVEAARLLNSQFNNKVICKLAGFVDSKNPQAIDKAQVQNWHDEGIIEFIGSTDNVKEFISEADCVVLPSYREGMSMVLMEAAAMKKPIIASNVPGCKELVKDEESGYLCRPKDHYDLYKKMKKMFNTDIIKRKEMGEKARSHIVENFDEKITISIYLEKVQSILCEELKI